jgi:hypothetical protein
MTNFNQNYMGNSQQHNGFQFTSPQAAFQPGFAGTDAQVVRQQNAQSAQGQYGNFQQGGQSQGGLQSFGGSQFTGSQAAFQPGFAGTDAQVVRQQNAQSAQGQYGNFQQGGQSQGGFQSFGNSQFTGPQAAFQPGFAGTDAQVVRQQNAQSAQGQFGGNGFQQSGQSQMGIQSFGGSQFTGSQAAFQPGFSGTDAQVVRQQNAQSAQGQFGGNGFQQSGQSHMGIQSFGGSQFTGSQAAFQPGFSGTDAQVVRQQNAQSAQGQFGGYQSGQSQF